MSHEMQPLDVQEFMRKNGKYEQGISTALGTYFGFDINHGEFVDDYFFFSITSENMDTLERKLKSMGLGYEISDNKDNATVSVAIPVQNIVQLNQFSNILFEEEEIKSIFRGHARLHGQVETENFGMAFTDKFIAAHVCELLGDGAQYDVNNVNGDSEYIVRIPYDKLEAVRTLLQLDTSKLTRPYSKNQWDTIIFNAWANYYQRPLLPDMNKLLYGDLSNLKYFITEVLALNCIRCENDDRFGANPIFDNYTDAKKFAEYLNRAGIKSQSGEEKTPYPRGQEYSISLDPGRNMPKAKKSKPETQWSNWLDTLKLNVNNFLQNDVHRKIREEHGVSITCLMSPEDKISDFRDCKIFGIVFNDEKSATEFSRMIRETCGIRDSTNGGQLPVTQNENQSFELSFTPKELMLLHRLTYDPIPKPLPDDIQELLPVIHAIRHSMPKPENTGHKPPIQHFFPSMSDENLKIILQWSLGIEEDITFEKIFVGDIEKSCLKLPLGTQDKAIDLLREVSSPNQKDHAGENRAMHNKGEYMYVEKSYCTTFALDLINHRMQEKSPNHQLTLLGTQSNDSEKPTKNKVDKINLCLTDQRDGQVLLRFERPDDESELKKELELKNDQRSSPVTQRATLPNTRPVQAVELSPDMISRTLRGKPDDANPTPIGPGSNKSMGQRS